MTLFQCKLISAKGYIIENFFRSAETEKHILDDLDFFEWPKGKWIITIENEEKVMPWDYFF